MSGPGRVPTISDEEILSVFYEATDPVLTTREVAEAIGLTPRGTIKRLKSLAKNNDLEMKKVGGTGAVWWCPDVLSKRFSSGSSA